MIGVTLERSYVCCQDYLIEGTSPEGRATSGSRLLPSSIIQIINKLVILLYEFQGSEGASFRNSSPN